MNKEKLEKRINDLEKNPKDKQESKEAIDNIKSSIIRITNDYYRFFLINDFVKFQMVKKELEDLIESNISDYPNINNFVNYCLLKNIICLLKSNLNLDVCFPMFHKIKLEEEPEDIKHYCTDLVMENIICYYVDGVDEIEKL